jgi:hypothetical protein
MSTQRRENRLRTTSCMVRAESFGLSGPAFSAQFDHAHASGETAPPESPASSQPIDNDLSLGVPYWLATNSLQSDFRSTQTVRLVPMNIRLASPPFRATSRAEAVTLKSSGSSFPHIPSHTCLARLHSSLPQMPAALSGRTERYDGKGNLHFKYAA